MPKYDTGTRDARMAAVMVLLQNGQLHLCQGSVSATLVLPAAGDILSTHAIGALGGSINTGVLTFAAVDVADATAANTGTITRVIIEKGGNAVAQFAVPSEMSVSLGGNAATSIQTGTTVQIDQLQVIEGNA